MARFLLASDDARTRIGVAGALERAGHQVDRVTHLRLAAETADLRPIDAIVVGLEQPQRREDFVRRVRARCAGIAVVALLDGRTAWQAQRLEQAGATVVLSRPLKVDELVARLEALALRPAPRPTAGRTGGPIGRRSASERRVSVLA